MMIQKCDKELNKKGLTILSKYVTLLIQEVVMKEIKLKTFPLVFPELYLRKIEEVAGKGNIKRFIMKAIEEKMEKESKNLV